MRRASLVLVLLVACASAPAPLPAPIAPPPTPIDPGCKVAPQPPASEEELRAPPDLLAPPAEAEHTPSGVASRVLTPGCGNVHPGTFSTVVVDYTGWTSDGRMFDSSITRGQPARFALNAVVQGWRDGVKLMVVGEKRRLWIPEELAYKGTSGPQGTLVFDITLREIAKQ